MDRLLDQSATTVFERNSLECGVILTPSIMPLVTFNSFFTTKDVNFVPEGNRGSLLLFTKDVTGTQSMLPGKINTILNILIGRQNFPYL